MSPRTDVAAALQAAAPVTVSVMAEEPNVAPALPALLVRPGSPYRELGVIPDCVERWRLEILALVAVDVARPLDALDDLVTTCRDVIQAYPDATYRGVRSAPGTVSIAGQTMRSATVEMDVEV